MEICSNFLVDMIKDNFCKHCVTGPIFYCYNTLTSSLKTPAKIKICILLYIWEYLNIMLGFKTNLIIKNKYYMRGCPFY